MPAAVQLDTATRSLTITGPPSEGPLLGYQIYDPDSGTFVLEGPWQQPTSTLQIPIPPERGRYRIYVSALDETNGWAWAQNQPFLLIEVSVDHGHATLIEHRTSTLRAIQTRAFFTAARKAFTLPVETIWTNRSLIRSMVRRDIMARYRGSAGDLLWAVLNPLLLMATYFFVFGVVLQSRLGTDTSKTGFVLYLLAGMLPWLAFSEAVGRSPYVLLEHRNFIKKLVFPVEILPITQTFAALVTQAFALGIFVIALVVIRGSFPVTALWLPALLIPQILFTAGIAWFLAALGVFLRDLGQIIGFLLTLWFFLTPICYPEASLPAPAAAILTKNPIYALVRGYRAIFLEASAPSPDSLWKLWLVACVVFIAGYAWFHKLRKSFADVV
ncbi:MAG: ABC transporter permease [Bryobacteraceae bacterium]|nr:ABC transporter permease [Bryobacteraceae bacterium]